MKKTTLIFCSFMSISLLTLGQREKPFSSGQWMFDSNKSEIVTYKGIESLILNNDVAILKDMHVGNCVIDFDVAFPKQRAFIGLVFRMADPKNYEEFYMRSHQSGNPDATQYTPVFNNNAGWQLYSGEGFSKAVEFIYDEWIHVRLNIQDEKAEVFLIDMTKPFMVIKELKSANREGSIGLKTFIGKAYYANFSIQTENLPDLIGKYPPIIKDESMVQEWMVSQVISEKVLKNNFSLSDVQPINWQKISTEPSGLLNLSRLAEVSNDKNTLLVKAIIHAEEAQTKKLLLGFSDRVVVFLNNEPIFAGSDNYQSRDYRFLGTIGLYDTVFLHLDKGLNELVIAISENFGGWGIQAKLMP